VLEYLRSTVTFIFAHCKLHLPGLLPLICSDPCSSPEKFCTCIAISREQEPYSSRCSTPSIWRAVLSRSQVLTSVHGVLERAHALAFQEFGTITVCKSHLGRFRSVAHTSDASFLSPRYISVKSEMFCKQSKTGQSRASETQQMLTKVTRDLMSTL
jgi:hypothetical protein